jgi:transcriptional regulator of acetoin/glycerol metabolism
MTFGPVDALRVLNEMELRCNDERMSVLWAREALERQIAPERPLPDAAVAPLRDVVYRYVTEAVAVCGGNKSRAATALGVDRRTLYRILERAAKY